jgi:hypothetical protein
MQTLQAQLSMTRFRRRFQSVFAPFLPVYFLAH